MFTTELQLHEKFIELKQKQLHTNENILSEFNARFGNVDIVQVTTSDSYLMNFEQANLLSTYQFAKIIGYLHKKAVRTFDYLVRRTDYSKEVLSRLLTKLSKAGLIEEVRPKRYIIANNFQFPNLQFTSFEAKLTDWKKAILQATINNKFSSYSYVVFPLDLGERLFRNNLHYFKNHNVGLIGVSNNHFEYLYKPNKRQIKRNINPSFISSLAKFQMETDRFAIT